MKVAAASPMPLSADDVCNMVPGECSRQALHRQTSSTPTDNNNDGRQRQNRQTRTTPADKDNNGRQGQHWQTSTIPQKCITPAEKYNTDRQEHRRKTSITPRDLDLQTPVSEGFIEGHISEMGIGKDNG